MNHPGHWKVLVFSMGALALSLNAQASFRKTCEQSSLCNDHLEKFTKIHKALELVPVTSLGGKLSLTLGGKDRFRSEKIIREVMSESGLQWTTRHRGEQTDFIFSRIENAEKKAFFLDTDHTLFEAYEIFYGVLDRLPKEYRDRMSLDSSYGQNFRALSLSYSKAKPDRGVIPVSTIRALEQLLKESGSRGEVRFDPDQERVTFELTSTKFR